MKRFLICLWMPLALVPIAGAQLLPGINPNPPAGAAVEALPPVRTEGGGDAGGGDLLIEKLKGIQLESIHGGEVREIAPGLGAGADLLLPSPVTLASKLAKWNGAPLTQGDLVAIADLILVHYDVEGYPVVGIDAPEQDLGSGTLRLVVQIGRIGNVGVKRPKYGDPKSITRGLKLRRGDILRRSELDEQMSWYGRTVFRKPQLLVSPGFEPATGDLIIALAEKNPWRVSLGYENTGPPLLGEDRFVFGFAGMTPNEHVIAWQTVLGTPVSSLQAHALGWEIPFQKIHQSLQLDAVYAEVLTHSNNLGLPVENTGTSWSVAATQKMFLPAIGKWRQRLQAGLEVKSTNQFVLFGGAQFSPGEVRLVDGKVNYSIGRDWKNGACSLDTTLLWSPGNLISGNDDADFQAYDPDADSDYLVWRMNGDGWWSPGGDWRIALRGSTQLANSRLLPVEQFSAGGYQTVRGVPERVYYADEGWQASLELYAPAIVVRNLYQARFLGFLDQAEVRNRGASSNYISGAGIGVRISLTDHMDFRLDQGWRLDDPGTQTHFGLQVTF